MKIFALVIVILLYFPAALAVVPSDKDYYVSESENFIYIYSDENAYLVPKLMLLNSELTKLYQKNFNWKLDEKVALALTSSRNQVANGFASSQPNLRTIFFPGGAPLIDEFATTSWANILLFHETAHLYQINAKSAVSQFFHMFERNTTWSYFVFIHPNFLTPSFIMEGNATYNESRFGHGGRLYAGPSRALTLQLIKDGKVNSKRLMNDHLEFPFGPEKYLVGGHLFAHIAEKTQENESKYGLHTNSFFRTHAEHYINPLMLNSSFKQSYGLGYEDIITDFNQRWASMARDQKSSGIPPLVSSISQRPMNRIGDEIVFTTSMGKGLPTLNSYNVKSGKLKQEERDLPSGKLFKLSDNKYWAATSDLYKVTDIKYSLYGEGYRVNKKYLNKFVFDLQKGKQLYLNISESFDEPQLYLNKEHLGTTHSQALFDSKGWPYYFRQVGKKRVLYRGKKPIGSFKGYYSQLVDIDSDGKVYFIGSTTHGSSLFSIKKGRIERLSELDTIVNGRKINDHQFLVTEITSDQYEYKVIETKASPNSPVTYDFFFEKKPEFKAFTDLKIPDSNVKIEKKPYGAFRNMRFSSLTPAIGYSSFSGVLGSLIANFVDPLEFNSFTIGYQYGEASRQSALVSYLNKKHRLQWRLGFNYSESAEIDTTGPGDPIVEDKWRDADAFIGLSYPMFKVGRWSGLYDFQLNYDLSGLSPIDTNKEYESKSAAYISHSIFAPLAYDPFRIFSFSLAHLGFANAKDIENSHHGYVGQLGYSFDFWNEDYLSMSYYGGVFEKPEISFYTGTTGALADMKDVTRFSRADEQFLFELQKVTLQLKSAFNNSIYFSQFPVSLRRWALFVRGNYFRTRADKEGLQIQEFGEGGGGIEFELLLLHKIPLRTSFLTAFPRKDERSFQSVNFSLKHEF